MRFARKALLVSCILCLPALACAQGQWILEQSSLTYHVSHPLHHVNGESHAARGKGICKDGECNFLIAAPVKSFDSGDTNRDLHMLEIVRGAQFPLVTVRTAFPENDAKSGTVNADLTVEFAGQTAHYSHVPFHLATTGNEIRVVGTVPATLTDFKITPPELLAMPVKNEIPVSVDMTWRAK